MTAKSVALGLVLFLLGGATLAFGAVEGWARAWLLVGAAAAFLAAYWTSDPRGVFRSPAGSVALPAALLVIWGLLQTLPLPRPIVSVLSPKTSTLQTSLVPPGGGEAMPRFLLEEARKRGVRVVEGAELPPGPPDSGSLAARSGLSIHPHATRRAALSWLAPILLFLAAYRVARGRVTRYRLLWGIAGMTGVLGALAVVQQVAWNERILWIRESPGNATPLGPFVNPNHFAGWVEMGLLVALGLAFAILGGASRRLSLENVRAAILDRDWALPRLLVLGGIGILGGCGMVLSGSRGGAIAIVAGLLFLLPLRRLRVWLAAAAAIVVLLGLAAGLASWLGTEEKTLQTAFFASGSRDPSLAMRSDIWGRTWKIVVDHPIVGTGLGTFRWAYAAYDREGEWLATEQAHNDYLQLVSETGLVGFGLLAWLAWAAGKRILRPALRRREGLPPWTTAALAAAVFAMLVHSVLEFNLQIPAVASLFAVLGGALAAAAEDPDGEESAA